MKIRFGLMVQLIAFLIGIVMIPMVYFGVSETGTLEWLGMLGLLLWPSLGASVVIIHYISEDVFFKKASRRALYIPFVSGLIMIFIMQSLL